MNTDNDSIDLPGDVIEGLARLDGNVTVLTPAVDRRVAEAARAHFADRPQAPDRPRLAHRHQTADRSPRRWPTTRRRATTRRWAMAGTLAASLTVGLLLVRTQYVVQPELQRAESTSADMLAAGDIDGSGSVDILDAFALASMGGDGPGALPQSEIDALVSRIVALDGSPRTL